MFEKKIKKKYNFLYKMFDNINFYIRFTLYLVINKTKNNIMKTTKLTNTTKLELIKEIKTDFGRNVKYYKLASINNDNDFNAKILKVSTMPHYIDNEKLAITEERFYGFIGNEYTTHLEKNQYRHKYVVINK
jgi:hypothetical protein